MGGYSTLSATLLQNANLIDGNNKEKKELKRQQKLEAHNRKNLLDEQLAARRASLGAMGLNTSGSNDAVNQRMINEYEKDARDIASSGRQKLYEGRNKRRSGLISGSDKSIQTILK